MSLYPFIVGAHEYSKIVLDIKITITPQPLRAVGGIVFTHGVRMGGWVGGRNKFVRAVSQKP